MAAQGPMDPDPRVYFLPTDTSIPEADKPRYVLLAYQAAGLQSGRIEKVLIRGWVHTTNWNQNGKVVKHAAHSVMSFKRKDHAKEGTHLVAHVYPVGRGDLRLKRMTTMLEPTKDEYLKRNGRPSWPSDNLDEWERVAPNDMPTRRPPFKVRQRATAPDAQGWQTLVR